MHRNEMRSGSEAGSYVRLIDFAPHLTLGVGAMQKEKKTRLHLKGRPPVLPVHTVDYDPSIKSQLPTQK